MYEALPFLNYEFVYLLIYCIDTNSFTVKSLIEKQKFARPVSNNRNIVYLCENE